MQNAALYRAGIGNLVFFQHQHGRQPVMMGSAFVIFMIVSPFAFFASDSDFGEIIVP